MTETIIFDDPFEDVYIVCAFAVALLLVIGIIVSVTMGHSITNIYLLMYSLGVTAMHYSIFLMGSMCKKIGLIEVNGNE